ncbi:MAG TPA: MXAN_5187 C-terminal domain-containing protein [Thermoanaerobaculia bacterium]|nr:MXAN_5187 C-terminal domain-containing protein [Thermoanaerobaculia bacterium]
MLKKDDEIDKLEEMIRVVKSRYDQFFLGIIKVPPMFERRQVDVYIHEMSRQKMRDNGRRFRFNTLTSRWNQFREMWGRKMREREEGPLEFQRRKSALEGPARTAPISEARATPSARVTSGDADPYVKVAPGTNGEEIKALLEQINRANSELGKASNVTFEQLSAMVQKQSEMVRERYKVSAVAFKVETVDGKVKLKAKPLQK